VEVTAQLSALPQPEILFNYVGHMVLPPGQASLTLARESLGGLSSGQNNLPFRLYLAAQVFGAELQMEWTYSSRLYCSKTVEMLAQNYLEVLRRLKTVVAR